MIPIGNRVDFKKKDFSTLIDQRGKEVKVEKALECPCRDTEEMGQGRTSCKNCGGSGYLFIDKYETRMVIYNIEFINKYRGWSEEMRGICNISCEASEELTFMDRITDLNGISYFNEVCVLKQTSRQTDPFINLAYIPVEILYIGMYNGDDKELYQINKQDIVIEGFTITIKDNEAKRIFNEMKMANEKATLTIRYKHNPTFHIVETKRETMDQFELLDGKENLQHLPIAAIGRRAHYVVGGRFFGKTHINNDSKNE